VDEALRQLLDDPRLWRGRDGGRAWRALPSGYGRLDALLPGGGWPAGRLTEIAVEDWGTGELQLLAPLLARLCRDEPGQRQGWLAWIAPPFIPYAPALAAAGVDPARILLVHCRDAEVLWAAEQALGSGNCGAVLAWADRAASRQLRRLQLAAERGETPAILFRPPRTLAEPSPASLRLKLADEGTGLRLSLLKHRGGAPRSLPADDCRHP
jgi:hypothetical protein